MCCMGAALCFEVKASSLYRCQSAERELCANSTNSRICSTEPRSEQIVRLGATLPVTFQMRGGCVGPFRDLELQLVLFDVSFLHSRNL